MALNLARRGRPGRMRGGVAGGPVEREVAAMTTAELLDLLRAESG